MNDKFDELVKGLAQSVTRRGALKKFGVGLTGVVVAMLALPNSADAKQGCNCNDPRLGCGKSDGCFRRCAYYCSGGGPPH